MRPTILLSWTWDSVGLGGPPRRLACDLCFIDLHLLPPRSLLIHVLTRGLEVHNARTLPPLPTTVGGLPSELALAASFEAGCRADWR